MSLTVLRLDPDSAGELALAIRVHRKRLERKGKPVPGQLVDLEHLAVEAYSGAKRKEPEETRKVSDGASYGGRDDHFVTQRDAAKALRCTDRSVRDKLKSGELPSVKCGGVRRIRASDLDAYLAKREGE